MAEILKFYSVVDCVYGGERRRFFSNEVEVNVLSPYVITQKSQPILPPKTCECQTHSILPLLLLCLTIF